MDTTWAADSTTHWEIGGNLTASRSSADYFPKAVELQKRIGAEGFVIVANSKAMNNVSPLKVIMSNSSFERDENAKALLDNAGALLASHVRKSSNPIYWSADKTEQNFIESPMPAKEVFLDNVSISGLAFPVHLGGKQSGMAIFFAPTIAISREMQIDIHRKVFVILRELLKIEMLVKSDSVYINARETECLQFAGNGMTSDEISEVLKLSVHTVNAHLSSATAKLDSVNRIQAIAKAIRLGLIR